MKSVLISIQPKWCELIARGIKTVEVRMTAPKLETPFKCYIYCTLNGINELFKEWESKVGNYGATQYWKWGNWSERKGKVIGEFVCDKIIKYEGGVDYGVTEDGRAFYCSTLAECTGLTRAECLGYGKKKIMCGYELQALYGWHITDLKIYDKPKEIYEFSRFGAHIRGGCCINGNCKHYISNGYYEPPECAIEGCALTRPPQSWCYVEELSNW